MERTGVGQEGDLGSSTLSGGTFGKPGTSEATSFPTTQEAAGKVHERLQAQESRPGARS